MMKKISLTMMIIILTTTVITVTTIMITITITIIIQLLLLQEYAQKIIRAQWLTTQRILKALFSLSRTKPMLHTCERN